MNECMCCNNGLGVIKTEAYEEFDQHEPNLVMVNYIQHFGSREELYFVDAQHGLNETNLIKEEIDSNQSVPLVKEEMEICTCPKEEISDFNLNTNSVLIGDQLSIKKGKKIIKNIAKHMYKHLKYSPASVLQALETFNSKLNTLNTEEFVNICECKY